jgi:hypothetical protein
MTEASASTSVRKKIKFNGNLYDDRSAVRDAYTSVCTKSQAKGVCKGVVRLDSEKPGDSTGPFVLRCKGCSKTCQLANPSKWFGEHKCKGLKGAAGKGVQGPLPQTVQQFGSTRSQQEQFKELVFKAMVTSCIPFNFVENS